MNNSENNIKNKCMKKKVIRRGTIVATLALTAVMMITLSGCSEGDATNAAKSEPIKDFQAQTLEGENVTSNIFAESGLTMVNIWATYCGPCINEMPDLGEISRSYDKSEFQIVGIVSDIEKPNDPTAEDIIKETKADYMHIVPSKELESSLLEGVSAVPTTVFIDKNGNMVGEAYVGSRSMSDWESIIDELLTKQASDEVSRTGDETTQVKEETAQVNDSGQPLCPNCLREKRSTGKFLRSLTSD